MINGNNDEIVEEMLSDEHIKPKVSKY